MSQSDGTQSETLLVREDEGVLTITLNRPGRLNAFNAEMGEAFIAALSDWLARELH